MKLVFRILKILGVLVGALVLTLGIAFWVTFAGGLPIQDRQRLEGVEVVKDGYVSAFIVDINDREVVLIDAGKDREAAPILHALARRNLGPEAVKAILLTHGDYDHTGGVLVFAQAQVMTLAPDVALAEGRAARGVLRWFGSPKPSGVKVTHVLHDGETLALGALPVRVFALPGHTQGSAAFLVRSVLFMGDSAEATKQGKLEPGRRLIADDSAQNRASLRRLAARLKPSASEIKAIACAHSGLLTRGLTPLTEFAANE